MEINMQNLTAAIEAINNGQGVGWGSHWKILYVSGLVQRLKNFVQSGSIDLSRPHSSAMEPSMECNISCGFCSYAFRLALADKLSDTFGAPAANIPTGALVQTRDFIKQSMSSVCLGGGGEPLFWADPECNMKRGVSATWFNKNILQDLGENGNPISLVSNFVLAPPFFESFMRYFTYLVINVPSVDEGVYQTVTNTNVLDRVLGNIRHIIENRERYANERKIKHMRPTVKVDIRVVVNKDNIPTLLETAQQFIAMGADFINFRLAGDFEGQGNGIGHDGIAQARKYMAENEPAIAQLDKSRTNLAGLMRQQGAMTLSIDGVTKGIGIPCWVQRLGLRAVFAPSGLFPCTQFVGRDVNARNDSPYSAGNASQLPLVQIINSPRHQFVTEVHARQTEFGICPEMHLCSQGYFNGALDFMVRLIQDGQEIPTIEECSPEYLRARALDDGSFI